jgi:uncharacterized FlaG/YvyC family protein
MDVSLVTPTFAGTVMNDGGAGSARMATPATRIPNVAASTQPPSADQLSQAINKANDAFAQRNQNLYASIETDKTTGIGVVKIIDKDSLETINQYPSKAIVEIAQSLQTSSVGQLINAKA